MKPNHSPLVTALLGLLLLLPLSQSTAAALTAKVDRASINQDETLLLTVRLDKQLGQGGPDFSLLKKNFDILSNNRGSQYRNINGRTQSFTQWELLLAPTNTGKLLIPSFSFQGDFSEALEINVAKQQAQQDPAGAEQLRDIFLEAELSKSRPRVQEQLRYTVRLYTAINLHSLASDTLEVDHAVTLQLAEHRYQRKIRGKAYGVVEIVYAIFPQNSGELVIPSITYQVTEPSRNRSSWSDPFGGRGGAIRRLRTDEQRLVVDPKPAGYNGEHWLPAENVQLEQDWSSDPNNFKVGEPITRVITLTAKGLTGAQLPPLKPPAAEGIKTYPDQPQTNDQTTIDGVTGIRTETMAIVPTKSGPLTLPAITLSWWDSKTNQQRQASLPATNIQVAAGATPTAAEPPQAPAAIATDPGLESATNSQPLAPTFAWPWVISTVVFALLSLGLGLALRGQQKQTTRSHARKHKARKQAEPSEKLEFKRLQASCEGSDLNAVRKAFLNWAQLFWPQDNIRSLQQARQVIEDTDVRDSLQRLDRAIYSGQTTLDWEAAALIRGLQGLRQNTQSAPKTEAALRPLYPNG